MIRRVRRAPKKDRRGATLVFIAIALPVFLFMAVMAVDIAYMQLVRTEHRAATDAAAKASAEALSRTNDKQEAIAAAVAIAAQNSVGGRPLALTETDFVFGRTSLQPDGSWQFTADAEPYTAVRVQSQLAGDNAVRLLLGSVMGVDRFSPERVSTAAYADHEVCLVVDRSHSMCFDHSGFDWSYPPGTPTDPDPMEHPPDATGSRWASLAEGIQLFLATVGSTDSSLDVALVTWGSEIAAGTYDGSLAEVSFPAAEVDVPLGGNLAAVATAIGQRGQNVMLGATNMAAGIDAGTQVLTGPTTKPHATKTMIVMTDGKWNRGRPPSAAALDAKQAGITVHTITFLETADQSDMVEVAGVSGGRHYHATDAESLRQIFYELATTLPVVLTD